MVKYRDSLSELIHSPMCTKDTNSVSSLSSAFGNKHKSVNYHPSSEQIAPILPTPTYQVRSLMPALHNQTPLVHFPVFRSRPKCWRPEWLLAKCEIDAHIVEVYFPELAWPALLRRSASHCLRVACRLRRRYVCCQQWRAPHLHQLVSIFDQPDDCHFFRFRARFSSLFDTFRLWHPGSIRASHRGWIRIRTTLLVVLLHMSQPDLAKGRSCARWSWERKYEIV